jgi:hypothetical protein
MVSRLALTLIIISIREYFESTGTGRRQDAVRYVAPGKAVFIGAMAFAAPLHAEVVQDWQNKLHYPARVLAIEWGNGRRLDAQHCAKFGAWTVCYDTSVQFAFFDYRHSLLANHLFIGGDRPAGWTTPNKFQCSNAAAGKRTCWFVFRVPPQSGCELTIWNRDRPDHKRHLSALMQKILWAGKKRWYF